MKRSEINALVRDAAVCFAKSGWALPPDPAWDVTDFGLGNWAAHGLVLINLANEAEYCEKLMYAQQGMVTPCHCHAKKKEDIICRAGRLALRAWPKRPDKVAVNTVFAMKINGTFKDVTAGGLLSLEAGERITIATGVFHEFWPLSAEAVLGEVSTVNDDDNDNHFTNSQIGRFPQIDEDEPAIVRLASDQ